MLLERFLLYLLQLRATFIDWVPVIAVVFVDVDNYVVVVDSCGSVREAWFPRG